VEKNLLSEGVYKDTIEYTAIFYEDIINESIKTCTVPDLWKTSTVIPVEKVKGTIKATEIRPINTLPNDEKILETVIKNQLVQYLYDNNLIIHQQSGFRKKHSCETAINYIISEWKDELNKKQIIIAVFLDLKRAFETIARHLLLIKIQNIGVEGRELKWFENYLTNRHQRTIVNSNISEEISVNNGLPQGSVLAPILFLVYINDIVKALEYCDIKLFADDALLFVSAPDPVVALEKIQIDLNNLYHWLCENKMKINIDKTKFMVLNRQNVEYSLQLKIKDDSIEEVKEIKYLGVVIDTKLKFQGHINHVSKKLAKNIGFLQRSCRQLSTKYKISVYKTIIEPHFIYCPSVLFILPDSMIDKLQKLQNRAMRFILKKRFDTPTREMLNELKWLSVKQKIFYFTMIFIFNIKQNNLPNYLSSQLMYNHDIHSINTRNRNDFRLPFFRNECDQQNLFYKGLKNYNQLPREIKNCNILREFKNKLYKHCLTLPIR